MHVRIYLPGPMEGEVTAKDINGKKVEPQHVDVVPYFFRPDGRPIVVHLESLDSQHNVIRRYVLSQSGTNGELALTKRTPCVSVYDKELNGEEDAGTADES